MPTSRDFALKIQAEMSGLINQRDYPCIAAVKSFHQKDFRVRTYNDFGKVNQRPQLRADLLEYLERYKQTRSEYFTFWAVFDDEENLNETQFETRLWSELSSLTSEELRKSDHDARFSDDPNSKNFCFSLGGKAFFVVGLHPQSSRRSRRFPWPTLIFNVFEQFDQLAQQERYLPMIQLNRQRDIKFQGSANPMAVAHNDDWETIQFSGKQNTNEWKCPFHFRATKVDEGT